MTIEKLLSESFQKPDDHEWQKLASSELNGGNPFELLQWKTPDGLIFLPYYGKSDQISFLQKFHLHSSDKNGSTSWLNICHVLVNNNISFVNEQALDHLQNGADGLIFSLKTTDIDFNKLLQKIEWPYCALYFIIENNLLQTNLEAHVNENYKNINLSGALFWKLPSSIRPLKIHVSDFKIFGIFIKSSTPTDEITSALVHGVQVIDRLQQQGLSFETIIENIAFSIPVGNNFLIEIGKLKALRLLWYQITQAYEITKYKPGNLHIHTRSEALIDETYQPHSNMLKSTIASMAAVIGGCNAHTIIPEDETGNMINRIARNNSIILKEESYFDKVEDALAGSFAIENIVEELSKAAWEKFKNQIQ